MQHEEPRQEVTGIKSTVPEANYRIPACYGQELFSLWKMTCSGFIMSEVLGKPKCLRRAVEDFEHQGPDSR